MVIPSCKLLNQLLSVVCNGILKSEVQREPVAALSNRYSAPRSRTGVILPYCQLQTVSSPQPSSKAPVEMSSVSSKVPTRNQATWKEVQQYPFEGIKDLQKDGIVGQRIWRRRKLSEESLAFGVAFSFVTADSERSGSIKEEGLW